MTRASGSPRRWLTIEVSQFAGPLVVRTPTVTVVVRSTRVWPLAELALNRRPNSHSQRRKTQRGQIPLGLVGVGPMWERRYRAALGQLLDRFAIRVVYDAVLAKAQHTAGEIGAEAASGLKQMFERTDLAAVLVLDPSWFDLYPAELACQYRKPTFLAGSLGQNRASLQQLHLLAQERDTRRYTPATSRLRELMATTLGEARQVVVRAQLPQLGSQGALPGQASEKDYLAGLLDWCQYITGRVPTSVDAVEGSGNSVEGGDCSWRIELGFRPDALGRPATTARLDLTSIAKTEAAEEPVEGELEWPFPCHEIVCEHGLAEIRDASEIGWRNGVSSELGRERLMSERSDAVVILDQFARRVLGGLVPVANLDDVCRALSLVEAAEESRRTRAKLGRPWG